MKHLITDYFQNLYHTLQTLSSAQLDHATELLDRAYRANQTIYVMGNGQSAATASAFALDLSKQTVTSTSQRRFRVLSLSDNMSAITAWGNDLNYESVFTEQLRSLMCPEDVLIAISVSGNSPNILHACQWARENGGSVIGLTGFNGGKLLDLSDTCLVFDSRDYGHVETGHVAVLHYWVDVFRERLAQ